MHNLVTCGLDTLLDTLQKRHISADKWYSMQAGIKSFRNSTDPQQHAARSDAIGIAYEQQTRIGWNNFLKGRVSLEWGNLMLHEYQTAHKGKRFASRRRFQTALIPISGSSTRHSGSTATQPITTTPISRISPTSTSTPKSVSTLPINTLS